MTVFAPAKINLALHVTGRRDDGYHSMDMLVAFADIGDRITLAPAESDDFVVDGPRARAVPRDGANLVLRARDALRARFGAVRCPPVSIHLTKSLPAASGMGGGSSDAAATLKGLATLWGHAGADLATLGAALGADVPMCLAARTLRARGVGEILDPVDGMRPVAAVLVNPGVEVSTPSVFKALDKKDNPPLSGIPELATAQAVARFIMMTRNDLQRPALALAPEISDALDALDATAPLARRMTGSGATCFGIYESRETAGRAAASMVTAHPGWFVAATRLG
ncbi:MAG: 4-(cytidine 5'-diphospho)-2-C-methyl-D-erythritol kinase [Phyllobacteriaceae bacterium]|nr:4-(cytidine 5'-diphospho)-2-C-methyl-D-erythritol kinase [Phyllobacteriaceae bacterium]